MKTNLLLWSVLLCAGISKAQISLDFGPDTSACNGEIVLLDASLLQADNYLWSDGSTDSVLFVWETGTYWLLATKDTTTYTDTINITFTDLPVVDLGPDDWAFWPGTVRTLSGPPGLLSYLWTVTSLSGNQVFTDEQITVTGQFGGLNIGLTVTDAAGCSNFDDLILHHPVGSVNEVAASEAWLDAFPNPASDQLTLRMKETVREAASVSILDLQGRTLKTEVWENGWSEGEEMSLDLTAFSTGSYLLQIRSSELFLSHPFVLQR